MLFYMWHAGFGDVSSQRGRDFNGEAYYVTPVQYTGRCIMWQNYSGAAESVCYTLAYLIPQTTGCVKVKGMWHRRIQEAYLCVLSPFPPFPPSCKVTPKTNEWISESAGRSPSGSGQSPAVKQFGAFQVKIRTLCDCILSSTLF